MRGWRISLYVTGETLLILELKVLNQLPKAVLPQATKGFTVLDDRHLSAAPSGVRSPWWTCRKNN